jgi:hypothetical protein
MAMNSCDCSKGYQKYKFQVTTLSQILDKPAIEVRNKHETFEPPAVPIHAQTGTSSLVPSS